MKQEIQESLLEMHYLRATVRYFEDAYGARMFQLLKPSPQREAWLGFDQGWIRSEYRTDEIEQDLIQTISQNKKKSRCIFLGFFLQYKVVKPMKRKSKHKPAHYSVPYYRSELSLQPNNKTCLSQHETLKRLSNIFGAMQVAYVCPMMFSADQIYSEPDISELRVVPIQQSPNYSTSNSARHFICFQSPTDTNALWCSDPVDAKCLHLKEWVSEFKKTIPSMDPIQALEFARLNMNLDFELDINRTYDSDKSHFLCANSYLLQLRM